MMNAFAETRNLFIQYTGYVKPLSYEEWVKLPRTHMAAVLFVQFYDEITLAWYKSKSYFVEEEDGVSIVNQYLEKNVSRILADANKFTSAYIYRVAYNCMYCISHDIKRDIARWENETSNITADGNDLFNTISSPGADDSYFDKMFSKEFWSLIEAEGLSTKKVVNHLLTGDSLKRTSVKSKDYKYDRLRDVSVSLKEMETIIARLRVILADYAE